MTLADELKEFISTFKKRPELGDGMFIAHNWPDDYWFMIEPYFHDFNKEIYQEQVPGYPNGVTAIRCDDTFFIVAVIPSKFAELSCREIVNILWPWIENPVFLEDAIR